MIITIRLDKCEILTKNPKKSLPYIFLKNMFLSLIHFWNHCSTMIFLKNYWNINIIILTNYEKTLNNFLNLLHSIYMKKRKDDCETLVKLDVGSWETKESSLTRLSAQISVSNNIGRNNQTLGCYYMGIKQYSRYL